MSADLQLASLYLPHFFQALLSILPLSPAPPQQLYASILLPTEFEVYRP